MIKANNVSWEKYLTGQEDWLLQQTYRDWKQDT